MTDLIEILDIAIKRAETLSEVAPKGKEYRTSALTLAVLKEAVMEVENDR